MTGWACLAVTMSLLAMRENADVVDGNATFLTAEAQEVEVEGDLGFG